MLVEFHCLDKKPSMQDVRLTLLKEHLIWVENNMSSIYVAGPLKQDNTIIGSLYIIEADSVEQAKEILFSDPYYHGAIWEKIEINEFNAYAGKWVGGKNWPTSI